MKDDMTTLEKALRAAYRERQTIEIGGMWEKRVMSHIRTLRAPTFTADFSALFGRFVWGFAPIATVLIIVLTIGLVTLDYSPEYEIAATFMADPIESMVSQLWGG